MGSVDCCSQLCCAGCLNQWATRRARRRRATLDCPACRTDITSVRPALAACATREHLQKYLQRYPHTPYVDFEPTSPELSASCVAMMAEATKKALTAAGWVSAPARAPNSPNTVGQVVVLPGHVFLSFGRPGQNDYAHRLIEHQRAFNRTVDHELTGSVRRSVQGRRRSQPIEIDRD